jgi:predicted RNase H-like HicB family nuclease
MAGSNMQNTYTAVVKKDGDWWIGWIEEIPGVNCQERTKDELMETLRVTLKEVIEFNRQEALESAQFDFYEEMPTKTRLTVTFEDDQSALEILKRKRAIEAMQKLRGSGNGNLVNALLKEREKGG